MPDPRAGIEPAPGVTPPSDLDGIDDGAFPAYELQTSNETPYALKG